jgi:hypothetical protein
MQRYFSNIDLCTLDRTGVVSALRRLVCSAVGDRLFECYRAADPSLGRIIRTVKRSVREMDGVALRRAGGRLHVCDINAKVSDTSDGLPLPPERLEAELAPYVANSHCTRDLVRAAVDVLDRVLSTSLHYPVSRLAQAIRSATVRVGDAATDTRNVVSVRSNGFRAEELRRFLQQSVSQTKCAKRSTYLQSGKVSPSMYDAYFAAIATYLDAQYVPPGRPSMTHHEALQLHVDVSRDVYRSNHRHVFEYLLRRTREAFIHAARIAWKEDPAAAKCSCSTQSGRASLQQRSASGRTQ